MANAKGIFCLEGDWSGDLRKPSSVEPILQLLRRWGPYYVPFIRRDVGTAEELAYYLGKWTQRRHERFPILYLAFHGDNGSIHVGDQRRSQGVVTLELLEELLAGRCKGRIIYFASCATLSARSSRLNGFLKQTGALAVCGYRDEVDWLRGAALELLVLAAMQDNAFTVGGVRAMARRVQRQAGYLARELGFRMIIRKP